MSVHVCVCIYMYNLHVFFHINKYVTMELFVETLIGATYTVSGRPCAGTPLLQVITRSDRMYFRY